MFTRRLQRGVFSLETELLIYMSQERELTHKEPISIFWIVIGLLAMIACMIGIERMVPRF
jgi:hypothetical protein